MRLSARLLLDTGEISERPIKRGYDTGIIMYELIYHGFEHPRGRQMVAALNRDALAGIGEVACWTCHAGEKRPSRLPRAALRNPPPLARTPFPPPSPRLNRVLPIVHGR